jgi:hypothetical protein
VAVSSGIWKSPRCSIPVQDWSDKKSDGMHRAAAAATGIADEDDEHDGRLRHTA